MACDIRAGKMGHKCVWRHQIVLMRGGRWKGGEALLGFHKGEDSSLRSRGRSSVQANKC